MTSLPVFQNPLLLEQALTHPSCRRRHKVNDFERLEFLGDRILGLIVAELLYRAFPKEPEGSLAKRSAALVNREVCSEVAQEIGLDQHLKVVGAELGNKSSVMGDAMEALLGALYLDSGLETVQQYVEPLWKKRLHAAPYPLTDYKSQLQEWSQKVHQEIPSYTILSATGPAHSPEFIIEVRVGNYQAQASGQSRKQAEQEAARKLLETVNPSTLSNQKRK